MQRAGVMDILEGALLSVWPGDDSHGDIWHRRGPSRPG